MQKVFANLIKATTLSLGLLLTTPVVAQQVPAPVINGVLHPQESRFFREGREKFEREIQRLNQSRSLSNTLLRIRLEKIERQERRSPDNKPQVFPSNKH